MYSVIRHTVILHPFIHYRGTKLIFVEGSYVSRHLTKSSETRNRFRKPDTFHIRTGKMYPEHRLVFIGQTGNSHVKSVILLKSLCKHFSSNPAELISHVTSTAELILGVTSTFSRSFWCTRWYFGLYFIVPFRSYKICFVSKNMGATNHMIKSIAEWEIDPMNSGVSLPVDSWRKRAS